MCDKEGSYTGSSGVEASLAQNSEPERIADLITRTRRTFSLTLGEIAASVQANETTLHRWRLGTSRPTAAYATRLKSLDDLLRVASQIHLSDDAVMQWFRRPDALLEGRAPREFLLNGRADYLLGALATARLLATGEEQSGRLAGEAAGVGAAREVRASAQEIAIALARTTSIEEAGAAVVALAAREFGATAALVAVNAELVDAPPSLAVAAPASLAIIAAANVPPAAGVVWRRYPITLNAPIAEAARTVRVITVVGRAAMIERYPGGRAFFEERGLHALSALPIATHAHCVGGISLFFSQPLAFGETALAMLSVLAVHCAAAVERARLVHALAEPSRQAARTGNG